MFVEAFKLEKVIAVLMESDKAFTGEHARDFIRDSQTNYFFQLGFENKEMMVAAQAAKAQIVASFRTDMLDMMTRFRSGALNYTQVVKQFRASAIDHCKGVFREGARAMGNQFYDELALTRKDLAFINKYVRRETLFFKKFLHDMSVDPTGRFHRRWPYDKRAGTYADSLNSQYMNGMVAGAGTRVRIEWRLGAPQTDHCDVCPSYANVMYTWQTLPTVPRGGDTPCLFRCHCYLVFHEPGKTKGFSPVKGRPGATATGALSYAGRFAAVYDSMGKEMIGGLVDEVEAFYGQMYKARQMMAVTKGTAKMDWIRFRRDVNQTLIDRLGTTYRAVPMVAVKDLLKTIIDAQEKALAVGGRLVPDPAWNTLLAETEVMLIRADFASPGKLFLRRGEMWFKNGSGLELRLSLDTDIVYSLTEPGKTPFDTATITGTRNLEAQGVRSGIHESQYVNLSNGDFAILKETPNYQNEVASYKISDQLGFDFVPETVVKRVGAQPRSCQKWVRDSKIWYDADDAWRNAVTFAEKERLSAFDCLMANQDRHGGNFMVNRAGKMTAIDNEFVLQSTSGHSHFKGEVSGQPISEEIKTALRGLKSSKVEITKMLEDSGVVGHYIEGMWKRLDKMLESEIWTDDLWYSN